MKPVAYKIALLILVLLVPTSALGQSPSEGDSPDAEQAEATSDTDGTQDTNDPAEESQASRITVTVVHKVDEESTGIADKPVFLEARRPMGPMERKFPEAQEQWTSVTNADGVATFEGIDTDALMERGLQLDAQVEHGGTTYRGGPEIPADGVGLMVRVFEKGADTSDLVVEKLRTLVYVWEEYLGFQQVWTLRVRGDRALDTSLLKGDDFENGVPLELPLKAEGINVVAGKLETKTINSTVYWQGLLKPGQSIPIRIDYSMPVDTPSYTYEQELAYPATDVDVGVMLDTGFQTYPRLRDLTVTAPGFETVESQRGFGRMFQQFGQRDFLVAKDAQIDAGDSFVVHMDGLPFEEPRAPWIALGLGLLGALFVIGFGRAESKRMTEEKTAADIASLLREEKKELMDELVALEEEFDEGIVTRDEYEREAMMLRERLALVMKKLGDLETDQAA